MHEQSETVRRKGGYVNVYGASTPNAGTTLPLRYRFEREVYPSADAAVKAARRRSKLEGVRTPEGRERRDRMRAPRR